MKDKADNIIKFLNATIPGKIAKTYWIESMLRLGDISEAEAGYIFSNI